MVSSINGSALISRCASQRKINEIDYSAGPCASLRLPFAAPLFSDVSRNSSDSTQAHPACFAKQRETTPISRRVSPVDKPRHQ
jgi:hypothetical protein